MLIYKIINKITGKYYIGKNKQNREDFLRSKYFGSGLYIKRAIKLHGLENFERKILCECSSTEELDNMEKYWIKELNSLIPNGYNIQEGGGGCDNGNIIRTEEWKKGNANGRKGKPAWNKGLKKGIDEKMKNVGKSHSTITREKQRRASVGKTKSDIHKVHISEVMKGNSHKRGKKHTTETKEKQRIAKIGFIPWNKDKKGIYTTEAINKMRESRLKNMEINKKEGKSWNGN